VETYYKLVIEGRIQGKPTRGRNRIGMLSDMIGKEDYACLKRRVEDRSQWRNWTMENEGQEPAE
jgi:hypothetical protein